MAPRIRRADQGVAVITVPDNRWQRVDIKSVSLLPNVLAKQQAKMAGAFEAWFVDRDGFVTEGSSTNAWIVTADGAVVTRSASQAILRGIVRTVLIDGDAMAAGSSPPINRRVARIGTGVHLAAANLGAMHSTPARVHPPSKVGRARGFQAA